MESLRLTIMLIAKNFTPTLTTKKNNNKKRSENKKEREKNIANSNTFHLFGSIKHAHATNNQHWQQQQYQKQPNWQKKISLTIFDYNVSNTMNIDKFLPLKPTRTYARTRTTFTIHKYFAYVAINVNPCIWRKPMNRTVKWNGPNSSNSTYMEHQRKKRIN